MVFAEGLVEIDGKWYLYYGAADTRVCLAVADKVENRGFSLASNPFKSLHYFLEFCREYGHGVVAYTSNPD